MLGLLLLAAGALSQRISYEGQQILTCRYDNPNLLTQLSSVDIQGVRNGFVDVRVQNAYEREFVESLTTCEVAVADLEAETQRVEALNLAARNNAAADWFDAYHTYDEISQWYQQLAVNNKEVVTWIPSVGTTVNNRALFGVRIFDRTNAPNRQPLYRVFWTAQIHAREWIAGATVQYLVNQTLEGIKNDAFIRNILNRTEILVLPIINPDGYVYSWTNDRQWRKNRKPPPSGSTCFGVDENRNFNDHWGQGGSSNLPCNDTYRGPSVASEPEVQAVQNFFLQNQSPNVPIIGAIDWHSYSQLVLRPYGWTSANSPDEAILKQIGDKYAADIRAQSGFVYTSQKSIDLYVTTGTASDWYYGDQATRNNGPYKIASYTVELRPTGANPGFVLPPDQIVPTGKENWAAIRNYLNTLTNTPIKP